MDSVGPDELLDLQRCSIVEGMFGQPIEVRHGMRRLSRPNRSPKSVDKQLINLYSKYQSAHAPSAEYLANQWDVPHLQYGIRFLYGQRVFADAPSLDSVAIFGVLLTTSSYKVLIVDLAEEVCAGTVWRRFLGIAFVVPVRR